MNHRSQQLPDRIIDLLNDRIGEYVLFYYGYGGKLDFKTKDSPIILLPKVKLDVFLSGIRAMFPNAAFESTIPGNRIDISVNDSSGEQLQVQCIHRLMYKSLCLMDEGEVNRRRVRHRAGFYIPSIEHLFEYAVLQCWIEYRGLADRFLNFFEELHILVQEDLLEYFNQKYATGFVSLHELAEFQDSQRTKMVKVLQSSPANGFMQNVKLRLFGSRTSSTGLRPG